MNKRDQNVKNGKKMVYSLLIKKKWLSIHMYPIFHKCQQI